MEVGLLLFLVQFFFVSSFKFSKHNYVIRKVVFKKNQNLDFLSSADGMSRWNPSIQRRQASAIHTAFNPSIHDEFHLTLIGTGFVIATLCLSYLSSKYLKKNKKRNRNLTNPLISFLESTQKLNLNQIHNQTSINFPKSSKLENGSLDIPLMNGESASPPSPSPSLSSIPTPQPSSIGASGKQSSFLETLFSPKRSTNRSLSIEQSLAKTASQPTLDSFKKSLIQYLIHNRKEGSIGQLANQLSKQARESEFVSFPSSQEELKTSIEANVDSIGAIAECFADIVHAIVVFHVDNISQLEGISSEESKEQHRLKFMELYEFIESTSQLYQTLFGWRKDLVLEPVKYNGPLPKQSLENLFLQFLVYIRKSDADRVLGDARNQLQSSLTDPSPNQSTESSTGTDSELDSERILSRIQFILGINSHERDRIEQKATLQLMNLWSTHLERDSGQTTPPNILAKNSSPASLQSRFKSLFSRPTSPIRNEPGTYSESKGSGARNYGDLKSFAKHLKDIMADKALLKDVNAGQKLSPSDVQTLRSIASSFLNNESFKLLSQSAKARAFTKEDVRQLESLMGCSIEALKKLVAQEGQKAVSDSLEVTPAEIVDLLSHLETIKQSE